MVFQEPLSAFDPLFTIGQQLDEVLVAHTKLSKQERYKKVWILYLRWNCLTLNGLMKVIRIN